MLTAFLDAPCSSAETVTFCLDEDKSPCSMKTPGTSPLCVATATLSINSKLAVLTSPALFRATQRNRPTEENDSMRLVLFTICK